MFEGTPPPVSSWATPRRPARRGRERRRRAAGPARMYRHCTRHRAASCSTRTTRRHSSPVTCSSRRSPIRRGRRCSYPRPAVIVDVGAPLSHAIIVSRELGIPCVVSVTDATRRIPDGAMVEVNGDTGTVTVISTCMSGAARRDPHRRARRLGGRPRGGGHRRGLGCRRHQGGGTGWRSDAAHARGHRRRRSRSTEPTVRPRQPRQAIGGARARHRGRPGGDAQAARKRAMCS